MKYIWQLPQEQDTARIAHFSAAFNISYPIIQTVLGRGFTTHDAIHRFLFVPKELVNHPSQLKDAEKAIDRIIYALNHKEKILIAGDYDVDGITSSALLMECLLPLGAHVNFFLPHRVHDGYGLSVKTIQRAHQSGYRLIITVDNGITAYEPARLAHELGIDLIITDHHRPHDTLPQACAIINPYQQDCTYPFKKFAGVGVGFKLMLLLYERLQKIVPEKVYELLLLGTVADVVPLLDENRYWVRYGLQLLKEKGLSKALAVLRTNAGLAKSDITATDIGFFITPQINALGRLEDPRDGVKFLIGHEETQTERIGRVLYQLNQTRKALERSIIDHISQQIESGIISLERKIIIASHNQWPPGIIGLVAGRLAATYVRPVILLHTGSSLAKGSCRSIPALNMFEALQHVQDILHTFGGHAQAAGLSLLHENIPSLADRLEEYIAARLTDEDFKQRLAIDADLTLPEVNRNFLHELTYLEPFGCENPKPLFRIQNVSISESPQLLKEAHVKCNIVADGIIKPIVFFNRSDLYEKLKQSIHQPFDAVVHVVENEWQGRSTIEFQGLDIALKGQSA